MNSFSFFVKQPIEFAWSEFKKKGLFWILVSLIPVLPFLPLLIAVPLLIFGLSLPSVSDIAVMVGIPTMAVLLLGAFIFSLFFQVGLIKMTLGAIDGKQTSAGDFFRVSPIAVLNFVLTMFMYSILVVVGLILLIVPGIYWAIKYGYAGYSVLDKGYSPIRAFKESGHITEGVKWDVFLLWHVLGFLSAVGGYFFVGFFVILPISLLVMAWTYRNLERKVGAVSSEA